MRRVGPTRLRERTQCQCARAQRVQRSEQLGRRDADDESERQRERHRFGEHLHEHHGPNAILAGSHVAHDEPDADQNDRRHEDRRAVNAGDHRERAAQQRVRTVAQFSLAGLRQKRRERFVSEQQRQREENAVPMGPAYREIRVAARDGGTRNGGAHDSTVR